jgi:hypothetical protein
MGRQRLFQSHAGESRLRSELFESLLLAVEVTGLAPASVETEMMTHV